MASGTVEPSAADLADARGAAEAFLQAVLRGDEAAARGLLIVREGERVDFKSMHESTAAYELGEAKAEGARVVVVATITAPPGSDAPPPLPLVLDRGPAGWRIDMSASIERMLGFNVEDMMKEMATGLGDAMSKGLEAMAEGLSALSSSGEAQAASEPETEPGSKSVENPARNPPA